MSFVQKIASFFQTGNRDDKIEVIYALINKLSIPDAQKEIYKNAIPLLDETGLTALQNTLVEALALLENDYSQQTQAKKNENLTGVRRKEQQEKQQEYNSLELLLTNL